MPLLRRGPESRLDERMCLACGYRGPDLQGDRAAGVLRCPDCGEDLYSRPPRSYRELEGFGEEGVRVCPSPVTPEPKRSRGRRVLDAVGAFLRRVMRRAF